MLIAQVVIVGLLGLVFGSFAGAQVWRIRARQLVADKKAGEYYDKAEYRRLRVLAGRKQRQDRSQCLACGHTLGVTDLVPLISWLAWCGRCRYCKARIGKFEPVMELTVFAVFVASVMFWPFGLLTSWGYLLMPLWLAAVVLLAMLAAYDYKWQLLPDSLNYSLAAVGLAFVIIRAVVMPGSVDWLSALGAIGMLAGVYGALYAISRGAWIGFGDVKLGIGLGLLLGDWRLAFVALFAANLIGCLLVMPGIINRSLGANSRISFGPLLIIGTLLAIWWGPALIGWIFSVNWFPV